MALLRMPEPYEFELSTERYRAFGPDLANLWHEDALHRVVGRARGTDRLRRRRRRCRAARLETKPVVRKLLGAEFDLDEFYGFATSEPTLAGLAVELRGLRPPVAVEPFESLVTSITAQQVSLHAAFAIRNRLIERFGARAEHAYAFPTRERIGSRRARRAAQPSASPAARPSTPSASRAATSTSASLGALPDDEVKDTLTALPGIGEWTADWFLARHLARPRAWPAGDLAVRKAVSRFYGEGRALSIDEVRALGERFAPFENLSAHYLLAGLARGT